MIAHTKYVLRMTLGVILILLGIVCVVLPVIPGWPLIIPGLLLVGVDPTKARYWLHDKVEHVPWLHRLAVRFGYRSRDVVAVESDAPPA